APEAADEDLAEVLGKRVPYGAVRDTVALASEAGLTDVKLYFMLGIPGETDEAADRIADYVQALERDVGGIHVTVAAGALVPKPHTELARAAVPHPDIVSRRLKRLRTQLRARTSADLRVSSARWSAVQTALSRGGRELGPVILAAGGGGPEDFERALRREGLALDEYLAEQTGPAPWEIVGECRRMGVGA
ncbi:MAG: hypothetical protein ACP5KN_07440, partial [Armatimonadota bacterium]